MNEKMIIGKIVNTHALRGELRVQPYTDAEDFSELKRVFIGGAEYKVTAARPHKQFVLLTLSGVDTVEKAELFRQKTVSALRDELPPLEENTYYVEDLIGMEVVADGEVIGEMTDCFPTGANDVYVVKTPLGKQILLPAIRECILDVNLTERRMTVKIMEGLTDDAD